MTESRNFLCDVTEERCTSGACKIGSCVLVAGLDVAPAPARVGEARKVTPLGRSRVPLDARMHRMQRAVAGDLVKQWERQSGNRLGRDKRDALVAKWWKRPKVVLIALKRVRAGWNWPAQDLNTMAELTRAAVQEVENNSK